MYRLPLTVDSVVDRHRFDTDTDPTFHFDAFLDPNPQLGKSEIFV
jgi:hypothetical protein